MDILVKPHSRGFFCDDESIQLPYFDSTIPTITLYTFGLTIPILLIFLGEYGYIKHRINSKIWASSNNLYGKYKIKHYYRNVFRKIICFCSGALYGYILIAVAKFTVGRLRPNFIALCGIDMAIVCQNKAHEYISNFTCPNGEAAAFNGRISFPSDHASFSFYAAVFTVLYLQKRLQFKTLIWKPVIQFSIILLAWWVSLTRVMDNQHHMSDVIAGIFIGTGVAIINTIYVHSMLGDEETVVDSSTMTNGSLYKETMSETQCLLYTK